MSKRREDLEKALHQIIESLSGGDSLLKAQLYGLCVVSMSLIKLQTNELEAVLLVTEMAAKADILLNEARAERNATKH